MCLYFIIHIKAEVFPSVVIFDLLFWCKCNFYDYNGEWSFTPLLIVVHVSSLILLRIINERFEIVIIKKFQGFLCTNKSLYFNFRTQIKTYTNCNFQFKSPKRDILWCEMAEICDSLSKGKSKEFVRTGVIYFMNCPFNKNNKKRKCQDRPTIHHDYGKNHKSHYNDSNDNNCNRGSSNSSLLVEVIIEVVEVAVVVSLCCFSVSGSISRSSNSNISGISKQQQY